MGPSGQAVGFVQLGLSNGCLFRRRIAEPVIPNGAPNRAQNPEYVERTSNKSSNRSHSGQAGAGNWDHAECPSEPSALLRDLTWAVDAGQLDSRTLAIRVEGAEVAKSGCCGVRYLQPGMLDPGPSL